MKLHLVRLLGPVVLALVAAASVAHAQGVTGSAVTGVVTGEGAGPLEGATVQLRNTSTGDVFEGLTNASGRYFIDNVPPGGPYTLTARFEGYPLTTQRDITLTLGQRMSLDLTMRFQQEEIVIVETVDPLLDRSRNGPQTTVRDTAIQRLPLQGRNFTDLVQTAPLATGNSIAGQNNRYNNIQIDGGANNDLFGLSGNGTPGGQANAKPLSIEAIKEFVVQIAPFDVRQSGFVGGLVNAITKSGTNEFHGSAFLYGQAKALIGKPDGDSGAGIPGVDNFHTLQFGASVGGPIIQDKLHFFVALDLQDRTQAFGNPPRLGFTDADVQRFVQILRDKYNVTGVGDASTPDIGNPDRNVFGKLTWTIDDRNRAEVSYNFVNASLDVLARNQTSPAIPGRLRDGFQLSNSGYTQANTTNTARFKLTSSFLGDFSNELLGGVSFIRDHRDMPQNLPLILVKVGKLDASDSWLAAGGERFSHANLLDQNIVQLQDNLSFTIFNDHRITVGTSNEFLHIKNVFFQAKYGVWAFNSLDDLDNNAPAAFQRRFAVSDAQAAGTADFNVFQLGAYVQDEWSLMKNLTLTPGFRVDVPFLSSANTNSALVAAGLPLPIDTGKVPTGNPLLSPRLGFNWDIEGNADAILRGGAGIFTGRPPYVWVSNAYSINGLSQVELTCATAGMIPQFTGDPNNQPSSCSGGTGTPPPPTNQGEIDYFDPGTRYPQNFEAALGFDKKLPFDIIASADVLYTRDVNGWYVTDENLKEVGTSTEGRTLYGTFAATGFRATPTRVDPTNLGAAVKVRNQSDARVYSGILQLAKRFGRRYEVALAYTYSNAQDNISLTSSQAFSNFQFAPLDGTVQNRNLAPNAFDRTHKITLTGSAELPYGFTAGLIYVGQSGTPYTWLVNGDVNADGINGNDLVFVPNAPQQITVLDAMGNDQYADLNAFIDSQDCLKNARGRFVKRGECRNPWQNFINLRVGWGMKTFDGQRFDLQLDVFNFLNLINPDWGLSQQVATFENANTSFLRATGYDATMNRPIYTFVKPDLSDKALTQYSATSSRWRIQLGARYTF